MSLQKQFVRVKSIKKAQSPSKRCKHAWTLLKYKPPKKLVLQTPIEAVVGTRPEATSSHLKPEILVLDNGGGSLRNQRQQLDNEDPTSVIIKYFNASNWPIDGSSAGSSMSLSRRTSSDTYTEGSDSYKFKRRLLSRFNAEQGSEHPINQDSNW